MAAAITTTPTRWCAAATVSCRWTSTCRVARRPPRLWSTASCSFRRRSGGSARYGADLRCKSDPLDEPALQDLGDYLTRERGSEVDQVVIAHDELTLWTRPD